MTGVVARPVGQPDGIDWQSPASSSARSPANDNHPRSENTSAATANSMIPPQADPAASAAAARPSTLDIPASARVFTPTPSGSPSAPWSQMSEAHAMNEQAASLVGVSIGREQTRMTSPTTPAAEKSAVLDRVNGWGFFDDTFEEREQLASIREDEQNARREVRGRADDGPSMSSPRVAEPRSSEAAKAKNRSRGASLFGATIPDINVKQILNNFNASSLSDALHKISPLSGSKDGGTPEKRSSRSNSLFAHRMTFGGLGRKDGSTSPGQAARASTIPSTQHTPSLQLSPFRSRAQSNEVTPRSESPEKLESTQGGTQDLGIDQTGGTSGVRHIDPAAVAECQTTAPNRRSIASQTRIVTSRSRQNSDNLQKSPRPIGPPLRRRASDGSMMSRTSTMYSFDADKDLFSNIDTMVNSRMKAVKDSWQDSSFRFKNVTASRRLTLMPDFLKSSDDGSSFRTRSLAGIFGDSNASNSSSQDQDRKIRNQTPPDSPRLSPHPTLDEALESLTGDVVLMGGYRGSVLRSAEPPHRQLWAPVKVGLGVRKVNLELGLHPEDEETEHERIFSSGILSHIGPIDISRRLIRRIKGSKSIKKGTFRFHDYGYDWRLSPEFLARKLIKFLESLPCNQSHIHPSKRGATVIAHSLGGLITRWAVNQRPELFAGVVYAGTPQHCVNILGPLRNGDDVLLSSKVLTAQVNFTLRTSFALLPESGRCFIDKDTEEEYKVDFFDPNQWREYRWSPCVGYPLPAATEARPGRSNSIMATLRDSVPSLPSLVSSKSSGNLPAENSNSNSNGSTSSNAVPPSSSAPVSAQTQSSSAGRTPTSPLVAAGEEIERKAGDLAHPTQHAVGPSMQQTPVPGAATAVSIPFDRAFEYLGRTLADTLRFKQALSHRAEHQAANAYPPLAVLYATCVPTVYGAKVAGRDGIRRADAYDNLVFGAGDGVVLARASMLPRGYVVADGGRVQTDRGHVGLLGDLEAVGRCLVSVIEARRKGVGLGTDKESVGN